MVADGAINRNTGRRVFAEVFKCDVDPEAYVKENGLAQVSDTGAIEPVIDQVLAANEKAVGEYLAGNEKNFQFLIGQAMKALRGKADPQIVRDVLTARLALLKGKS
jgi:aspartyl-tRNA(Asn)/glutamyl-tRNA(Gln) amidotransferase subunit B